MDIYKRNIEALEKTHPHLVKVLEATSVDREKIVVSHMPSGDLQIIYKKANGEEVVISDSHDLSGLPKKATELIDQHDQTRIILLLGFGLGGYPEALHTRLKENGILIVYEAVPEIFKTTLQERDISSLLKSPRFVLILGDRMEDFDFVRKFHRKIVQKNFYILKQTGCIALNKPKYERFRTKVTEAKRFNDSGIATAIGRSEEWTDAFIRNIPIILKIPGVIRLKNLFKERPAVIVSAGPSIEKNLHLLFEAKGRAIIIAVDVVVPNLLAAGIIPDFIVALEANRKLFRAFENNPFLRFCPLVCTPEVDYETITSIYPGLVFLNPAIQHPVLKWFHSYWEDKGFIPGRGGSVSHMAFALAQYLGVNVIALMGQDLSFGEKLHAGEVTRLFYSDNDVEEYRRKNPVVKDIFGEERYTTNQFLSFRTAFERLIRRFAGIVINTTEGGLSIEGARNMRLRNFLDEYCQVSPVDSFEVVLSIGEIQTSYNLPGLVAYVRETVINLNRVRKNAADIIECVLSLRILKNKNMLKTGEALRLIKEIERKEKNIEDPIVDLIAPYRYSIENYLRRDEADNDFFDAIQDSLDYYDELIRVIEQTTVRFDTLLKALERESEVDRVLADGTLSDVEKFYKAGVIHSEMGMVREAVRNLEKAANEFSKIEEPDFQKKLWTLALNIHWILAGLYMKQYRLYEAQEILRVLKDFAPYDHDKGFEFNKASVESLINTCKNRVSCWETQEKKMKQLFEKASKEYGSYLETGNFYFRIGDYDRAKSAYSKEIEEDKSLLDRDICNSVGVSIRKARIVAAFFGLAQTHLVMMDVDKAVQALDMGSSYISDMDTSTGDHGSEFRILLTDLYEKCAIINKSRSLHEKVDAV